MKFMIKKWKLWLPPMAFLLILACNGGDKNKGGLAVPRCLPAGNPNPIPQGYGGAQLPPCGPDGNPIWPAGADPAACNANPTLPQCQPTPPPTATSTGTGGNSGTNTGTSTTTNTNTGTNTSTSTSTSTGTH